MNTYTVRTRHIIPENWCSGMPVRLFGIYLYTKWRIAKEGYKWQCNECFNCTVKHKFDLCNECKIEKPLKNFRQQLCDISNKTPYGNERGRANDRAIDAIENLLKALSELK